MKKIFLLIGSALLLIIISGGSVMTYQFAVKDFDKDGSTATSYYLLSFANQDCDDDNNSISPSAVEVPNNGIDEDCKNGDLELSDEFLDGDQDGFTPNT